MKDYVLISVSGVKKAKALEDFNKEMNAKKDEGYKPRVSSIRVALFEKTWSFSIIMEKE